MKKLIFPFIAIAVLAIGACGGAKTAATPEEAVAAFFNKLSKMDIDGAKKYATKESATLLDLMKMGMAAAKKEGGDKASSEMEKFKDKKFEIGKAVINGDEATVPVTTDGDTKNFTAKKEDGSWKVAFDKSTMMKGALDGAGSDKLKDAMENAGSAGDTLKDMMNNTDLKEAMDKANDALNDPAIKEAADKMKEQLGDPKKLKELQEALEKLKEN